MYYLTLNGTGYDTDARLNEAERHILQKLVCFESIGLSPEAFRQKSGEAFAKGWNNQGAVTPGGAVAAISEDLAQRVALRSGEGAGPDWLLPQVWPGRYQGGGFKPGPGEPGGMVVEIIDAADRTRGRVTLSSASGQSLEEACAGLAAEAAAGRGVLFEALGDVGLVIRGQK